MAWIIVGAVVVVILLYGVATYNKLVRLRNQSEESAAAIDAHLKKRYDLVPNLVETVKGYAKHESQTLTAVIEARNKAMSATTLTEKNEASNAFSSTLKSLFALSESYPDLKANQGFLDLQSQLQKIEEELLHARKYYNAVINDINTMVQTIPSSIVASIAHFAKLPYLTIADEERSQVNVRF
ncbi:MAG: LemA family protein [Sphaerochaetaceae bacterium]|jgi:LemA protein|nr:LemA family protein [Sphaerochaetaceae bacterium]MDD3941655.1 LemA family protein [Sphaerochaetaceae bacterium]MDX9939516.1 LemA family protein [Sphaerochaetaceae bacterium]